MSDAVVFALEVCTAALLAELAPLFERHYAELAPEGGVNVLTTGPYLNLQALGILRVFTARQAGELIGYSFFTVVRNPQYGDALHSKLDLLFLRPESRKGSLGMRFMRWCDEQLAASGVEFAYRHLNVKNDHGALLKRLGYALHEHVYTRRLHVHGI